MPFVVMMGVSVMMAMGKGRRGAMGVAADFCAGFQFQCGVPNTKFCQLPADGFLDGVPVCVGDDVHRGAVTETVDAADVNVMNILYAFYF